MGLPLPPSKLLGLFLSAHSGLPWAYLYHRVTHCVYCSGPTRAYLGTTFANVQVIRFIALGLHGATLGLPLPTSNTLGLLLWAYSGLPWACLCQRTNHWLDCSGPIQAYLRPTFVNEQLTGFVALGLLGPTLGLPLPTNNSFGLLLWVYSGLPWPSCAN